ncbi:MAG: TylF/MycF family methyltransferase [Actinomycetota bacterium]|nr:TylF/MycF family methyltransferase [Actinomycetota bacterium]
MAMLDAVGDHLNGTAPLVRPGPDAPPAALYLDLLKRCLTRFDLDQDLAPVVPGTPVRRRVWAELSRLLERRDILTFRRMAFQPRLRESGLDWPAHAETMIGLKRLDNLQRCIEDVVADGVAGDLLEAGVWRGGATILMRAVLAARGETSRSVWVADSFQGLPKPRAAHPADKDDVHWSQPFLAVSEEEVKRNFTRYGLLDERVKFLPGWFSDTLPTAPIERLAVLRVDCDMYGSTTDVLTALYPKVSVGGFTIVDDYGDIPSCRAAVEDYRAEHHITEPLEPIDANGVFWRRQN